MKNKFKAWMDKPITNGSVIKLMALSMVVGLVEIGAIFIGPYVTEKIAEKKEKKEMEQSIEIYESV